MITAKTKREVKKIGDDSWTLINFENLRKNAGRGAQIEALQKDLRWQQDHLLEISGRIDELISKIRQGKGGEK